MRGDPSGPGLLQPGVAVVESEDEDSTTSLDFNTSDFLPFWDYTEVTKEIITVIYNHTNTLSNYQCY